MIVQKELIHPLIISVSGEQQLFQIKLPKNALKITGIATSFQLSANNTASQLAVVVDGTPRRSGGNTDYKQEQQPREAYFSVTVGNIKLRLNNPKNIFYAQEICALELQPDYEELLGIAKVGFDDYGFATRGTELKALNVEIDNKDTIIGGYYKDEIPVTNLFPYRINIYITYEFEQ